MANARCQSTSAIIRAVALVDNFDNIRGYSQSFFHSSALAAGEFQEREESGKGKGAQAGDCVERGSHVGRDKRCPITQDSRRPLLFNVPFRQTRSLPRVAHWETLPTLAAGPIPLVLGPGPTSANQTCYQVRAGKVTGARKTWTRGVIRDS